VKRLFVQPLHFPAIFVDNRLESLYQKPIGGMKNHVVRPGVEKRKAKAKKHRHSRTLPPAPRDRHRERLLN
jgi:hypothetical protein